jgi:ABC-type nitrate/sulfonate/bicarbonate transport system ATPase subunit
MAQLEDYLKQFTYDNPKSDDYVAIDIREEDVDNGDSVAIDIKDEASATTAPSNYKSESNHELKLFWLACSIVSVWDRWIFILWLLSIELISSLATFSLMYEYKTGVICAPVLLAIMRLYFDTYKVDMMLRIKRGWKLLALDYFQNLSQADKNAVEDMTDFNKMVDRASNSLYSIFSWGLPIIISGVRKLITIFSILILRGYWKIIFSTSIIYGVYFYFYMGPKQKTLAEIRASMKEREKWIVGLLKWTLNLFQKGKRDLNAILEIEDETDALEISFFKGWDNIAGGMTIISAIVAFIGLVSITNWSTLLLFKIIFDDLKGTIGAFSNFANSYASRSKEFDKFLAWFMDTNGREDVLPQQEFPNDGLIFTEVNISLGKFSLVTNMLSILQGQVILLKGKTGAGKTQLVNALQGLLPGAILEGEYSPIQYSKSFEYLDQHMRSSIPSSKLELRRLLDGNIDNELIMLLISVVQLDKIAAISDIDEPMNGYSGGQKMKVALLFTLLEVIKEKKTVLVLDEPEQGLDPISRLEIVSNVLNFVKNDIQSHNGGISVAVLLIYHGDDLDIVKLSGLLTKMWLFEKVNGGSIVKECINLIDYCNGITSTRRKELDSLLN